MDGWDVIDLVDGTRRQLVPDTGPLSSGPSWGIRFSGDGRYLLVPYALGRGAPGPRATRLVAFDLRDGREIQLVEPGTSFGIPEVQPSDGVSWIQDGRLETLLPLGGRGTSIDLGPRVYSATTSPSGDTLAYVQGPTRAQRRHGAEESLHLGEGARAARETVVAEGSFQAFLGWRDEETLVVRTRIDRLATATAGGLEPLPLPIVGDWINPPEFAADLWAAPFSEPSERLGLEDPRRWYVRALWVLLALVVLGAVAAYRWVAAAEGPAQRRHRPQ
ncbi:hypothetical protein KLP28_15940 [Nocardioidaceae bacterium]|nr:hypothetical protein KLP28_15940 [Nocardioidaceae bacterium]